VLLCGARQSVGERSRRDALGDLYSPRRRNDFSEGPWVLCEGVSIRIDVLLSDWPIMHHLKIWRRLLAEFIGSAVLATLVIGSGIAAQQLSPGNIGLQLFENAAATAVGLYAIILVLAPVSGAHLNPVVSLVDAIEGGISWRVAGSYIPVQVAGCVAGAALANTMFSKRVLSISQHHRITGPHFLSEVVATAGLVVLIFGLSRTHRAALTPAAVGAYIGAAYFFTSSTSFANPAITVGRMFSNTFTGIAPSSVPWFVLAQIVGGLLALLGLRALFPVRAFLPGDGSDHVHGASRPIEGSAHHD